MKVPFGSMVLFLTAYAECPLILAISKSPCLYLPFTIDFTVFKLILILWIVVEVKIRVD